MSDVRIRGLQLLVGFLSMLSLHEVSNRLCGFLNTHHTI